MKYRFTITTPDGVTFEALPLNGDISLTQRLNQEENGAFFYRTELEELRFNNQNGNTFSILYAREQTANRCDEFNIILEYNVAGTWTTKFTGFFTMAHCEFDLEKCIVSFAPEPDDLYRCLIRNFDVEYNILAAATPITVVEPLTRPTAFSDPFYSQLREAKYEFYVTNGTAGQEPYNQGELGYAANNQVTINMGGNTYQVFWRVTFVAECQAGVCPASFDFLEGTTLYGATLLSSDCTESGTCLYVIDDENNTGTVPEWDEFILTDFSVSGSPSGTGNTQLIASNIYSGEYLFVNAVLADGASYSNGRTLQEVLEFLLNLSCPSITSIRSNFFRINPTAPSSVLAETDKFANVAIYQITDVSNFDADEDATKGMMSLEQLLSDLSRLNLRWKVDGTTLVIEHIADIEPSSSVDYTSLTGFRKYKYDRSNVPKREIFSSIAQRNPDFVGLDVVYTGGCVGDTNQDNNLQLFTADIPFINAFPNQVTNEGFVLMHFIDVGGTNYIRIETGAITQTSVKNAAFSWANIHAELYTYRMYDSAVEVNGSAIVPDSIKRLREANISFTNQDLAFNGENLVQTELGTGIVTEASTSLRTCRCSVTYRF